MDRRQPPGRVAAGDERPVELDPVQRQLAHPFQGRPAAAEVVQVHRRPQPSHRTQHRRGQGGALQRGGLGDLGDQGGTGQPVAFEQLRHGVDQRGLADLQGRQVDHDRDRVAVRPPGRGVVQGQGHDVGAQRDGQTGPFGDVHHLDRGQRTQDVVLPAQQRLHRHHRPGQADHGLVLQPEPAAEVQGVAPVGRGGQRLPQVGGEHQAAGGDVVAAVVLPHGPSGPTGGVHSHLRPAEQLPHHRGAGGGTELVGQLHDVARRGPDAHLRHHGDRSDPDRSDQLQRRGLGPAGGDPGVRVADERELARVHPGHDLVPGGGQQPAQPGRADPQELVAHLVTEGLVGLPEAVQAQRRHPQRAPGGRRDHRRDPQLEPDPAEQAGQRVVAVGLLQLRLRAADVGDVDQ